MTFSCDLDAHIFVMHAHNESTREQWIMCVCVCVCIVSTNKRPLCVFLAKLNYSNDWDRNLLFFHCGYTVLYIPCDT